MKSPKTRGRLIEQVLTRVPFTFTIWDYLKTFCLRMRCYVKDSYQKVKEKKAMYEQAEERLKRLMDIEVILKRIRKLKLIKNIILSKSERNLLRYFRSNIINEGSDKDIRERASAFAIIGSMNKQLRKQEFTKSDKQILKNLFDRDTFEQMVRPALRETMKILRSTKAKGGADNIY